MALTRDTKKKIIRKHQQHESDTGSARVQVALLTQEISLLTDHLQKHKKDHSARRGLLGKVAQRRKVLKYLQLNDPKAYRDVLEANKLKK
jgi:small subunit ribosomal protein S15